MSTGQYQHLTFRAITMARGQLISMLYDKATDISITAADPTAALTLMSADIERIDTGWRTAHDVWANLVEIAVAIFLLERQLGVACLIPVGAAICELFTSGMKDQLLTRQSINPVSIVGSVIAVSFVMARQAQWLEAIERRIAVTSQMLGSMKGVKMCGLTDVLGTHIHAMRMEELRISGKFRRLLIWNMGLGEYSKINSLVPTLLIGAFRFSLFCSYLRPHPYSYYVQSDRQVSGRRCQPGHKPHLYIVVAVCTSAGASYFICHIAVFPDGVCRKLRAHPVFPQH